MFADKEAKHPVLHALHSPSLPVQFISRVLIHEDMDQIEKMSIKAIEEY